MRKLVEQYKRIQVQSFGLVQQSIQAVGKAQDVEIWKKSCTLSVRSQALPLNHSFEEIIAELKQIAKVVIEFLQAISEPKIAMQEKLKKSIQTNKSEDLKQQLI